MYLCPIYRENTEQVFRKCLNEHKELVSNAIQGSTRFSGSELPKIRTKIEQQMRVQVVNIDSIECARIKIRDELKDERPVILNMASHRRPGGGYSTSNRPCAQEESLCRRTFLFHSLEVSYRKQCAPSDKKKSVSTRCRRYYLLAECIDHTRCQQSITR